MSRITEKIKEVEEFLEELEEVAVDNFEKYLKNIQKRLACERAFEKIVEATNDLAMVMIKEKRFPLPSEDIKAFDVLTDKKIIPTELGKKLKDAKGMRNFIIHQYGKINDELVFEAVSENIVKDVEDFIKYIKKNI